MADHLKTSLHQLSLTQDLISLTKLMKEYFFKVKVYEHIVSFTEAFG